MSYPIDLDEMDEDDLVAEIQRRKLMRSMGRCDYCGSKDRSRKCKMPMRHEASVSKLKQLDGED